MSLLPPPVPPGWYTDPWSGTAVRWWDGRAWTAYAAPVVPDAPAPMPTLPLRIGIIGAVVLAVSLLIDRAVATQLADHHASFVVQLVVGALIAYGPTILVLRATTRRYGTRKVGDDLGLRFRWADLGWGPLVWVTALGAVIVVGGLVVLVGIPYTGNVNTGGGKGIRHIIPERILAAAVVAVVVAPFVEELVFRGLILRALRSRLSLVPAVLIQGVLFGAAHAQVAYGWANVGLIMVLSTIGIVLGFYAAWRRRLGPTILAHAIWNGLVVLFVAYGPTAR